MILAVCTANVCRSPFLEQLLRARLDTNLDRGHGLTVASAGVRAPVGAPLDPPIASLLANAGVQPSRHSARQLTTAAVAAASLVIAATREHRAASVRAHPPALRYALTVADLLRLLPLVDAAPLPAEPGARLVPLVRAVAARRGTVPPGDPLADDVADPVGGTDEVYAAVAARLTEAVDLLVDRLRSGRP